MSTSKLPVQGGSATLEDCARLWVTLTTDYIPDLRVELSLHQRPNGGAFTRMDLVDYSGISHPTLPERSVWSTKEFFSPLYLISHTQLFDLLIKGYRVIDEYFSTGKDNRPSTLKG